MRSLTCLLAAALVLLHPMPAGATRIDTPSQRGPSAELAAWLRTNAEETGGEPVRLDARHALQLWQSADGVTWTLVLINAAGTACIVAHGRQWDRATISGEEL